MTNIPVRFRVDRINEAIEALKEDFAIYLKDKEYPLEERWNTFCAAPDQLSTITKSITPIHDMKTLNVEPLIKWQTQDLGMRGVVLRSEEIIEIMLEEISWELQEKQNLTEEESFEKTDELVDPMKEEILEKNIKGFTLDW
jgi:hypothetical protein